MPVTNQPSLDVINAAIKAQQAMVSGSATFQIHTATPHIVTDSSGSVNFSRNGAVVFRTLGRAEGNTTDRVYRVIGSKFSAYDYYSDESIHRSVPTDRTQLGRLIYALGAVPDPVSAAIDPSWLGSLLHNLVKGKKAGSITMSKTSTGLSLKTTKFSQKVQLQFNHSGLLTSFSASGSGSNFSWRIDYSKKLHEISIPSGGLEVSTFSHHSAPPKYASGQAKSVCLSSLRAYRKLKQSKVVVVRPDRKVTVYWDQGKLRQNTPTTTWVFDGKNLAISLNGKFYRGKSSRGDALDYLAFLTKGEDSLSRSFLLRSNLLDSYLGHNQTVTVKGSMVIAGVPSTVVQVQGPITRSSLVIRNTDHLIAHADTDTLSSTGQVLFHDECMYHYLPFSPSASLFALKPNPHTKISVLPRNAIVLGSKYTRPDYRFEYKRPKARGR